MTIMNLNYIRLFIIIIVGAAPLVVLSPAPLADWPSHLARVWVTEKVLQGDLFWSARYVYNGLLIPNAVLDASMLALQALSIPFPLAAIFTLLLCYGFFIAGFICLARRFDMPLDLAAALATASFYTGSILLGLINYVIGLGLTMLFFSFWVEHRTGPARRAVMAVIATPLILFCHLVAGLLFAGMCGVYDLMRPVQTREKSVGWLARLIRLAPAVLSLIICIIVRRFSASGTDNSEIMFLSGVSNITTATFINAKLRTVADGFSSGSLVADLLLLSILIFLPILVWKERWHLCLPTSALAICMPALVLVAPFAVGEGSFLDSRLVLPAVVIVLIALPWWRALSRTQILAICLLSLFRVAVVGFNWHAAAPQYALIEDALVSVPPKSTLLAAYSDEPSFYQWRQPPLWNSASLAVFHNVFVPSMFAEPTQQPLAIRPGMRPAFFPAHYANAREPGKLVSVRQTAQRLCATEPNTYLFVLHPSEKQPVTIEPICKH